MPDTATSTTVAHGQRSYLDFARQPPAGPLRYVILVVAVMAAFSLLGGLLSVPIDAVLPDNEISALLENLLPFVGSLALLVAIIRVVMHRPVWTFAAPDPNPQWRLFGRAALIQLGCLALSTAVFVISPIGSLEVSAPGWATFAAIVPIALVGFAVQTLCEELVFRGVLPQTVYRFTNRPVVVYGLPALVFASLHAGNVSALGNGPIALVPYLAMASLWGWVSYRTGSLWTSWGLHFANNIYLVLLIGNHDDVTNPVSGIDFVYAHPDADNVLTTSLFGTALTAIAVWYLILRRFPRELSVPRPADSPITKS